MRYSRFKVHGRGVEGPAIETSLATRFSAQKRSPARDVPVRVLGARDMSAQLVIDCHDYLVIRVHCHES